MRMNIAAALTAGTILLSLAGCSAAPESTPTSTAQITTSAEEISEMTTEKTTSTETSATSEMIIQTEETTTVTVTERSMTLKIGEHLSFHQPQNHGDREHAILRIPRAI